MAMHTSARDLTGSRGTTARGRRIHRSLPCLLALELLLLPVVGCDSPAGPDHPGQLPEDLYLELDVGGGIAGVSYAFALDGETGEVTGLRCGAHCPFEEDETVALLSRSQVEEVARIFVDAGILTLNRTDFGSQCCDQFYYVLRYSDGKVERTVRGSSEVLPDEMRRAVATLVGLARGVRPIRVDFLTRPEDWPRDPLTLESVSVDPPLLTLEVEYSGGCNEHTFDLVAWNGWLESHPVQVGVFLAHEDFDDACDGVIRRSLSFDLTPLQDDYRTSYGSGGTFLIRLMDPHSSDPSDARIVEYTF